MGRDPNIGRAESKNRSRQGDSNPSKRFFARYESLQSFCKNIFFPLFSLVIPPEFSDSTTTDLLHHTHLIWLYLNKIRLLHHKSFSKSFNGRPAAAEQVKVTKPTSTVVLNLFLTAYNPKVLHCHCVPPSDRGF